MVDSLVSLLLQIHFSSGNHTSRSVEEVSDLVMKMLEILCMEGVGTEKPGWRVIEETIYFVRSFSERG